LVSKRPLRRHHPVKVMTLYDPIEGRDSSNWFPATPETGLLVACLLASKDSQRLLDALGTDPLADSRGLTLLATPAISLSDNVATLHGRLAARDVSSWPAHDRENLRTHSKALNRLKSGPLRQLRSTLSAHHDPKVFGAAGVDVAVWAPLVIEVLGESLFVLVLLLNHDAFSWSRFPRSDRPDLVQFHQEGTVAAPTFRTEGGRVVEVTGLTIVRNPREDALETVRVALNSYNDVAGRTAGRFPRIALGSGELAGSRRP
jgi:hypothetical protein